MPSEMHEDHSEERAQTSGKRSFGQRGVVTSRPSRETIMQSYVAEDQARARSARMRNQESYKHYQAIAQRNREREDRKRELEMRLREEEHRAAEERRRIRDAQHASARSGAARQAARTSSSGIDRRVVQPLSSQESHEYSERSRASFERERESRDAFSPERAMRSPNREIIDGRGSIDSRAFNERHDLVSYSIDESDRPDPMIDTTNPKAKWHSHSGNEPSQRTSVFVKRGFGSSVPSFSSSLAHSRSTRRASFLANLPTFVKVVVPLIVVLLIILIIIVFF